MMKNGQAYTTGLFLSCALFAAGTAYAQADRETVRELNARVLQFHAAHQRADSTQMAQIRRESTPLFAQRAAALKALIRQSPGAALELAFSQDLIDDLAARFPASARLLEKHGVWQGRSEHIVLDDPAGKSSEYQVRIRDGSEILQVYSAQGEPDCISGSTLAVTGVRIENLVAAAQATVKDTGLAASAGCSTLGVQNSAVLLVQFPGVPLPATVTQPSVYDMFFGTSGTSVDGYWREASYGKASASGNVFGPFTLDKVYTCGDYWNLLLAAMAAAEPVVNFPSYTRVFIVFPDLSCTWSGLGMVGCTTLSSAEGDFQASPAWLVAGYMTTHDNGVKLATHEGGHGLTLNHARSRDFGGEALGPPGAAGTLDEYGDLFSTMGSWNLGHYSAQHKVQLGWLPAANVLTTETNGSYGILPYETTAAGVQAVKVRRGAGNDDWLWVEYRQPFGKYDSTLNSQSFSGGLIHYQDSTTGTFTHILDFTPATPSFGDPALSSIWVDPYTNVSLYVTSASSSALSLNVTYGVPPCVRLQPAVSLSPSNPSANSGTTVSYTVTVLNNDTAGCTGSTFTLSSSTPSGWLSGFSPTGFTLSPGQSATATMTKSIPAGFTPGTYAVNATASDVNHTATGTANVTVTAPPPQLQITTSASPASVKTRDTVTIKATVTNYGAPLSNASVMFTLNRPNGPVTQMATTNSLGVATWLFKAQQKGNYSVTASVTFGGVTVISSPATFTAQ